MSYARSARGSDLNRTLEQSPRHRLAEPRQPRKKNTPCISDLAGVKFLLKKERMFFFRGSALQVFRQCGGAKCGLGFAETIFWGKDLAKPRLILFLDLSARRRGLGRNPRGLFWIFWRRAMTHRQAQIITPLESYFSYLYACLKSSILKPW